MKDVGGAVLAGSTPPFRWRERAAIDVDVQDVDVQDGDVEEVKREGGTLV